MLCPIKSMCYPHRLSTYGPRSSFRKVIARAAPEPRQSQPANSSPTAAQQQVYVQPGQLLTTMMVKQYKQMVDGGMTGEAALASMENTEFVVTSRVGGLREEFSTLRKEFSELKVQMYTVIFLVVLGLTLTNVGTLPSTVIGTVIRKLIG